MLGVAQQSTFGRKRESIGSAAAASAASHAVAAPATVGGFADVAAHESQPAMGMSTPAQTDALKARVLSHLYDRIDTALVARLSREEIEDALRPVISEILDQLRLALNQAEQAALERMILHDLAGLGPLEDLIADDEISDILVNGPDQVYIERRGKLELTSVRFRDNDHVLQIAQRICNQVGRRVDQSRPLADARLPDGSRVNIVTPPLSLKGPTISIRRFSARAITVDTIARNGGCSPAMAQLLKLATSCRLNMIICGGTGSGKTTLLNALSQMIDPGERVITIEDAAELRLQQPHVVTLETRPSNLEGQGQVSIRDLVINALRMRPDRIILGEVRGPEAFDLLAAMNTGHDGSMCTLHANSAREATMRLENMVLMSELKIPRESIVRQIAESVDMIVQIKRLRDGSRRITSITEVSGFDGKVLLTQELFKFEYLRELPDGSIFGDYSWTGVQPRCIDKIKQFERADELREICR